MNFAMSHEGGETNQHKEVSPVDIDNGVLGLMTRFQIPGGEELEIRGNNCTSVM